MSPSKIRLKFLLKGFSGKAIQTSYPALWQLLLVNSAPASSV